MFCLVLLFIIAVGTAAYGANINISSPSFEGRIMGGVNTRIENYPYQISLEYQEKHQCGGSLIRPDVVLTAAHCIESPLEDYSVRAGSSIIKEGGQVVQVRDICIHSKYDTNTHDYDVAVLKLNKPLHLNSAVQLINLLNVGEQVPVNTMATVTGWGLSILNGPISKILQKIEVPKVDHRKCQQMWNWTLDISKYTDRMTCYGYINRETHACQGDSGGPLVANGKQVGIASKATPCFPSCMMPSLPDIYTRLENEEIHYHINNCLAKFSIS